VLQRVAVPHGSVDETHRDHHAHPQSRAPIDARSRVEETEDRQKVASDPVMSIGSAGAGDTSDQSKWIYLSDGGHFENLGLYEMVRRRCRRIVVSGACHSGVGFVVRYRQHAHAARSAPASRRSTRSAAANVNGLMRQIAGGMLGRGSRDLLVT
jgi:hypothetical protein